MRPAPTEVDLRDALINTTNALADIRDVLHVVQMALMLEHRESLTRRDCDAMLHVISIAYDQAVTVRDQTAMI